jgi:thymidylate synthase (FAD)
MQKIKLVWATPDIDGQIAYIARVSNPDNQLNKSIKGLLNHMMEEGHVSPFSMANVCLEFNMPRDIARQALRHSSIKPQEFSQRYQTVDKLGEMQPREFRLQDHSNRQSSIDVPHDDPLAVEWGRRQLALIAHAQDDYNWCIANGGAKEVARVILPEGLTPSRLYFNGDMRSWIHYLKSRLHKSTQKEHRLIAEEVLAQLRLVAPVTIGAFFKE